MVEYFRRGVALALALALTFWLAASQTFAQKWPEKPVRIVTPFAPGGGTDVFGRILAQRLSETFGQQFVVENRPGAGSTLGTEYVAKAPPDGYTLLITSASFSFNPGLYPKLRFDPLKDFTPLSQIVTVPHVIVVLPSFPARNVQEFVKLARERPGQVLYASSGPGSAMHLAGALFGMVTHTELTHVAYKGGSATVSAVMGGEATTAFNTLETVIGQLRAKRLRALAVSTRERAAALPDVPTVMESGVKGYEAIGWFGLLAPAHTAPTIVDPLSGEIAKTMASPAMRERAAQEGATAVGNSPAEFRRFLEAEIPKWTRIIQQAGIRLE
jgi:tripartite-type tricarboxylate transporter receptor subunit TctC